MPTTSSEPLNSNCNGKCSSNVANEKFNSELRKWLDSLPLSKPVQSPGRDFSDAVMAAEIVAHFLPRYITLNSFVHVHSLALKKYNWESLHKVVLRHLGIRLGPELIDGLARGDDDGAIELFLPLLRSKINDALAQRRFRPSSRSQSRSCSRGGSQLHLDQIGAASGSQSARGQSDGGQQKNTAAVERPTGQAVEGAKNKDRQIPVLDEMDKDQLIERLYAKVRAQETQLIRKDEQIEALTRRVDKLVELICEKKRRDRPMDGSGNQMQNNNSNNCDFD